MMVKLEDFVPLDHPLRAIRALVNEALTRLNGLFNEIYADTGRASIAPEKLMRALLLQVFKRPIKNLADFEGMKCARRHRRRDLPVGLPTAEEPPEPTGSES